MLNCKDHQGQTPLHCAVINGHTGIVNALLGAVVDVNALDKHGQTPFHYASKREHVDLYIINALMVSGADVNALGEHGQTPLHKAADDNRLPVAFKLIQMMIIKEITQPTFLNEPKFGRLWTYWNHTKVMYDNELENLKKEVIGKIDGKNATLYGLMIYEETASKCVDSPEILDYLIKNTSIHKEKYPLNHQKFQIAFLENMIHKENTKPEFLNIEAFQDLSNYWEATTRWNNEVKGLKEEVIGKVNQEDVSLYNFCKSEENALKYLRKSENRQIEKYLSSNAKNLEKKFPVLFEKIREVYNGAIKRLYAERALGNANIHPAIKNPEIAHEVLKNLPSKDIENLYLCCFIKSETDNIARPYSTEAPSINLLKPRDKKRKRAPSQDVDHRFKRARSV